MWETSLLPFPFCLSFIWTVAFPSLGLHTCLAIRSFVCTSPASSTHLVSPGSFRLWRFGTSWLSLPPPLPPIPGATPGKAWRSNRIRSSWSHPNLDQLHATMQVRMLGDHLDSYAYIICFSIVHHEGQLERFCPGGKTGWWESRLTILELLFMIFEFNEMLDFYLTDVSIS